MAGGPFIAHRTIQGERWDTVAWDFYGADFLDPEIFSGLIAANPSVPIMPVFDPGLIINVPIVVQSAVASDSDLPPWKRSGA